MYIHTYGCELPIGYQLHISRVHDILDVAAQMLTSCTSLAVAYFHLPGLEWIDHVYHWHPYQIASAGIMKNRGW